MGGAKCEPFQGTMGLRKSRGGIGHWASRQGGKAPELRATSSKQSGALLFLKENSVHPNRCKTAMVRSIEDQCISEEEQLYPESRGR
jgi:hypothetical protein